MKENANTSWDGVPYTYVSTLQADQKPTAVSPEPATSLLIAGAMVFILVLRVRKLRRP